MRKIRQSWSCCVWTSVWSQLCWMRPIPSMKLQIFCFNVFQTVAAVSFMSSLSAIRRSCLNLSMGWQRQSRPVSFEPPFNLYILMCNLLILHTMCASVFSGLQDSELQIFYTEASQKMEKWIGILDIALIKLTPALATWPVLCVSFYTYSTTDLSDSALELPFPMWYNANSLFILLSQLNCDNSQFMLNFFLN